MGTGLRASDSIGEQPALAADDERPDRVWDGELRGLAVRAKLRQHRLAARRAPFLAALAARLDGYVLRVAVVRDTRLRYALA
uniref:Uncharacterized protein n=1 Tax=Burkholderia cenocepacia TaxID=95486 RepID=A0A071MHA6_9BURK